jgi:hypothetical protein
MNKEAVASIQALMGEKIQAREKLYQEWLLLAKARDIYLAADRKHYIFDTQEEARETMLWNFNPWDTYEVKQKKKSRRRQQ